MGFRDTATVPQYGTILSYINSGDYIDADGATMGTGTFGVNSLRLAPVSIPITTRFVTIGLEITAAGGVGSLMRLGVYGDNRSGYPGALLLDAGTIDGTVAAFTELGINLTLPPGIYWIGGVATVAAPTMRTINGIILPSHYRAGTDTGAGGFAMSGVAGALPASFNPVVSVSSVSPRTMLKVA